MIGIDLVENERIASNLDRLSLRVLSDLELEVYHSLKILPRKVEFVAGRFAAKEAIFKALDEVKLKSFKDYSILNDEDGKPICKTSLNLKINVSISHTASYTTAIAIIL